MIRRIVESAISVSHCMLCSVRVVLCTCCALAHLVLFYTVYGPPPCVSGVLDSCGSRQRAKPRPAPAILPPHSCQLMHADGSTPRPFRHLHTPTLHPPIPPSHLSISYQREVHGAPGPGCVKVERAKLAVSPPVQVYREVRWRMGDVLAQPRLVEERERGCGEFDDGAGGGMRGGGRWGEEGCGWC